jgi:hypothetical protein
MDTIFTKDIVWRYWAVTTLLLIGVVTGIDYSLEAVITLNAIQVFHFLLREKNLVAFPVQVRITYFGLLFLAQAPFMFWIFWWQLIGTAAMVLFQYCFLARLLSLLPWNLKEPLTLAVIKRTFFSAPIQGNVLQGLPSASAH